MKMKLKMIKKKDLKKVRKNENYEPKVYDVELTPELVHTNSPMLTLAVYRIHVKINNRTRIPFRVVTHEVAVKPYEYRELLNPILVALKKKYEFVEV